VANAMLGLRTVCIDLKRRHAAEKFFVVIGRAVVFHPAKSGGGVFFLSPELLQKKAVALSDSKRQQMVE
jgi:hypothetical protein